MASYVSYINMISAVSRCVVCYMAVRDTMASVKPILTLNRFVGLTCLASCGTAAAAAEAKRNETGVSRKMTWMADALRLMISHVSIELVVYLLLLRALFAKSCSGTALAFGDVVV